MSIPAMIELNEWVVQIIENEVNEDIEIVKKSVQKKLKGKYWEKE